MTQWKNATFLKTSAKPRIKGCVRKGLLIISLIVLLGFCAVAVSFFRAKFAVRAESGFPSSSGEEFDSIGSVTGEDLSANLNDGNGQTENAAQTKTFAITLAVVAGCAGLLFLAFFTVKRQKNNKNRLSESKREKQVETVEKFIAKNPASYADVADMARHGKCRFVYAGEDGVLLQDESGFYEHGTFVFAAENENAARRILLLCPEEYENIKTGLLACHGEKIAAFCRDFFAFDSVTPCYQVIFRPAAPLPVRGALRFEKATETHLPEIIGTYDRESPEALEQLVQRGKIYCAFAPADQGEGADKEAFVGYIGQHAEGSMGLLYIFPEYRRRGYAQDLESFQINAVIAEGRTPYAHVIEDNSASLALQKKLGAVFADDKVIWMSRSCCPRD